MNEQPWNTQFPSYLCTSVFSFSGMTMHYVFKDPKFNNLSKADIKRMTFSKLKNKNLTIFGDSLQLQLFRYLVKVLDLTSNITKQHVNDALCGKLLSLQSIDHGQNGFLKCLKFYNVWDPDLSTKKIADRYFISTKTLLKFVEVGGIVIFNFGLHYKHWNLLDFHRIVSRVAVQLGQMKKNGTTILFRNTLPQHFPTASNTGIYSHYTAKKGGKCVKVTHPEKHPSDIIMEHYAKIHNISILNDYILFLDRWELHSVKNKHLHLDCTHFCYTPELAVPQLVLMNQLLI